MRDAAVAIEKNAVERAIRPAWARALAAFLARLEGLGRAQGGVERLSSLWTVRALGVSKLVSLAIVGGRPRARRPPGTDMANIASQKKRILRSERERTENRLLTSTVKTHFRRLESAVDDGDAGKIEAEHKALVSKVDKAVQKGALHKNTGRKEEVPRRPNRRRRQLVQALPTPPCASVSVSARSSP